MVCVCTYTIIHLFVNIPLSIRIWVLGGLNRQIGPPAGVEETGRNWKKIGLKPPILWFVMQRFPRGKRPNLAELGKFPPNIPSVCHFL